MLTASGNCVTSVRRGASMSFKFDFVRVVFVYPQSGSEPCSSVGEDFDNFKFLSVPIRTFSCVSFDYVSDF